MSDASRGTADGNRRMRPRPAASRVQVDAEPAEIARPKGASAIPASRQSAACGGSEGDRVLDILAASASP